MHRLCMHMCICMIIYVHTYEQMELYSCTLLLTYKNEPVSECD